MEFKRLCFVQCIVRLFYEAVLVVQPFSGKLFRTVYKLEDENWRMNMPVSGVVVTCLQGQAEDVAGQISAMDGVEIHGLLPDDQIVAVVEAETVNDEVAIVSRLHEVDGVLTVRMAYHNFEDEA
jgi:nitrate reductase NapD